MTLRQRHLRIAPDQDEPTSDLDGLIGYNLKRAYILVLEDYRRALGEDGFAPPVFSALSVVVQFPDITQSELARRLGIERSGLVAIIDSLQERGLVTRKPVPGDRRVQALIATRKGRTTYADALARVRAHEAAFFGSLSAREREALIAILRKIRAKST